VNGSSADFENFGRLIEALTPWLDQVVIIGGWAPRLYRFHPWAQELDYPPVLIANPVFSRPKVARVPEAQSFRTSQGHPLYP